jgi:rare lipoprotein A
MFKKPKTHNFLTYILIKDFWYALTSNLNILLKSEYCLINLIINCILPRMRAVSISLILLLSFCESFGQIGFKQKGRASYYAHDFHGRKTANGEKFNMNAFTAAHKTLDFNCLVKVINTENNRSVVVRINDRGPYYKNRILDLSRMAAHKLGIVKNGTARVKLEVIGYHNKTEDEQVTKNDEFAFEEFAPGSFYNRKGESQQLEGYGVQIGAFKDKENAVKTCLNFEIKGFRSFIKVLENGNGRLYRIIVGVCKNEQRAEKVYKKLKRKGWNGFITKYS